MLPSFPNECPETVDQSFVSNDCWPSRADRVPLIIVAMPDYGDLTDLQLTIMSVLWNERDATIGTIHGRLSERGGGASPATRKTIAMLLSRLEQRGLVAHRMDGREGVYRARVAKKSVLRSRIASLLGAVFIGQERLAGAHALDPADVRAGDVDKLVAMLRQLERDVQKEG